jgi:DNA-binding HxlR family transcriptional regulator
VAVRDHGSRDQIVSLHTSRSSGRLGDKWTILALCLLSVAPDQRLRFTEVKYGAQGISQRMLTLTLRHLERDGLILRHYHAEVPPRVEYELSAIGRKMQEPLRIFAGWIREAWPAIEEAREDYDYRSGKA